MTQPGDSVSHRNPERVVRGTSFPVVAKFHLNNAANNQSTNVDHLYVQLGRDDDIRRWIFVELKTDRSAVRPGQFDPYLDAIHRGMPALMHDLKTIGLDQPSHSEICTLVSRFANYQNVDRPIELIVLSTVALPSIETELGDHGLVRTFSELKNLDLKSYGVEWDLFKQVVFPVLDEWARRKNWLRGPAGSTDLYLRSRVRWGPGLMSAPSVSSSRHSTSCPKIHQNEDRAHQVLPPLRGRLRESGREPSQGHLSSRR